MLILVQCLLYLLLATIAYEIFWGLFLCLNMFTLGFIFYAYKILYQNQRNISDFYLLPLNFMFALWKWYGKIGHAYEISGFENIPRDRPVLFITYHPNRPYELLYFQAEYFFSNMNKQLKFIVERTFYKTPGLYSI